MTIPEWCNTGAGAASIVGLIVSLGAAGAASLDHRLQHPPPPG
jgi:hypothetical protein